MKTSSRRAPLSRLLQIVLTLQSDRRPNACRLAEECEVSRRTIFRDLGAIEAAGLIVEYDASRQGYRLVDDPALKPPALEEAEVHALTLLVNGPADPADFGLMGLARSGLSKLIGSLPGEARRRAEALDAATSREAPPSPVDEPGRDVRRDMLDAILRRIQVRLTIRQDDREVETTLFAPYRLLSTREGWAVVGRSSVDRCVRLVPLAWVETAVATKEPAEVPPRFRIARWLERAGHVDEDRADFGGSGG